MGTRGPAPARSDQRRRRNAPETPVDKVEVDGEVTIPEPGAWHDTAIAWYRSLQHSGQSRFFEPSDWQAAHFTAQMMHKCLTADEVSAQMVAQVRGMMTDLLSTESSRRRVGIELERKVAQPAGKSSSAVTHLEDRRKRLTSDAS